MEPLTALDLDGKERVLSFYVRSDSPRCVSVVDSTSDEFRGHFSRLNGSKGALARLIDEASASRYAAFKLDYLSGRDNNAVVGNPIILVEDPKFDKDLERFARRSTDLSQRSSVLRELSERAKSLSKETLYRVKSDKDPLAEYADSLEGYAALSAKIADAIDRTVPQIGEFAEADRRDLVEIAGLVVEMNECDPDSTVNFIHNIGYVVANLGVEARRLYLDDVKGHKILGGIEQVEDYVGDVKRGFVDFGANLDVAVDYANRGIRLETDLGGKAWVDYAGFVEDAVTEKNMLLKYAVDGAELFSTAKNKDLETAVSTVVQHHFGANAGAVRVMNQVYDAVVRGYGLEDAALVYTPAFFATLERASELFKRVDIVSIAKHVEPAIKLFRESPDSLRYIGDISRNALFAFVNGITTDGSADDSWKFGKRAVDIGNARCDFRRWTSSVQDYVKRGLSLDGAMKLSDALEFYARDHSGVYRKSEATEYLRLQAGATSEREAVNNTIFRYLSSGNGIPVVEEPRGVVVRAGGSVSVSDGRVYLGDIES